MTTKEIRIYVANLSMYNSGKILGNWFTLPIAKQQIFRALKIGQEGFGEEWIILDYEAPFKIHEYESIDKLNDYAEKIEELPNFLLANLEEVLDYESLEEIIYNKGENFEFHEGVNSERDLAFAIIDYTYGGISNVPAELLQRYFNYDSFGRDLNIGMSGFFGKGGYVECTN
ncbi:antirestriction protein ArdA [Enterococcus faecalis]|nr:antirestriction protein ArdA [Enterococcus faecalis]